MGMALYFSTGVLIPRSMQEGQYLAFDLPSLKTESSKAKSRAYQEISIGFEHSRIVLTVRLLIDYQENWIRSIARASARVKIMDVKAPRPGNTQNFVELASENAIPGRLTKWSNPVGPANRICLTRYPPLGLQSVRGGWFAT
jgi:hypothetical protein